MSTVQSIERAFSVLENIAKHPEGIGVTAIATETNLHKSTVSRLLSTLETLNAVERLPAQEGFRLGHAILSMATQLPFSQQLQLVARPFLIDLASATGEAVGLSLPDGDDVFFIDQVQGPHNIRVRDWTGSRFPMHVVSSGKLYLAHRNDRDIERYARRPMAQFAKHSITTLPSLQQRVALIRQTGIDWSIDEFEDGLTAVSAPIYGPGPRSSSRQEPLATVYICGPNFRFPHSDPQREEIETLLRHSCAQIAARLQL